MPALIEGAGSACTGSTIQGRVLRDSVSGYSISPAVKFSLELRSEGWPCPRRKEVTTSRSLWDAHNNRACRGEREKALALYNTLSEVEREKVPQVLRVWLRYRSEKYFGDDRTPPRGRKPS